MVAASPVLPASPHSGRQAPLFPGHPLLGAGPLFQSDPIGTFFKATDLCGDVARLKFPVKPYTAHVLRHPDHIRRVLVTNSKNYGKQTRGYEKLRHLLGSGLVTSEGEFWRRQRRIANPAFHHQQIARFGEVMVRCTQDMLDEWSARIASGEPFDVANEMMRVTLRIIGLTMLSTDVQDKASVVGDAMNEVLHLTVQRIYAIFNWPAFVPTPSNRRFFKAREALDDVIAGVIAQRRSSETDPQDLLSMLMTATDPETGEAMSDLQLRDEAMTMFLAGHETTANALAWTFYLLSSHPDIERRLRAEIAEVLGDRPPTLADLRALTYSEQVIKESMRLYPPIWALARSAVEEDEVGGFTIPKGSWIFTSPYITHRDPRFWSNPEGFDPDRWTDEEEEKRPVGAYFPFALGPRKCIGEAFAMMEARLILVSVLQRSQLALVPGHTVQIDPTITLRPEEGIWVKAQKPPARA